MANDEVFIVLDTWQAVELNSIDIQDGIYSLFNLGKNHIEIIRSDVTPTDNTGSSTMTNEGQSRKYALLGDDKLFVRTPNTRAQIGVIKA